MITIPTKADAIIAILVGGGGLCGGFALVLFKNKNSLFSYS